MSKYSDTTCRCCLREIMPVLSRKWSICVIATLGRHGRMRFSEILLVCRTISPRSLTIVLQDLQEHGIATRQSFPEIPPRVEYSLTIKGMALWNALVPLFYWAREYHRHVDEQPGMLCFQAPDL